MFQVFPNQEKMTHTSMYKLVTCKLISGSYIPCKHTLPYNNYIELHIKIIIISHCWHVNNNNIVTILKVCIFMLACLHYLCFILGVIFIALFIRSSFAKTDKSNCFFLVHSD